MNTHDVSDHFIDNDHEHFKNHHAYFTTKTLSTLMFEAWLLGTIPGLVVVLVLSLFLAVLYEGIRFYVNHLKISMPRVVSNNTVIRVVSKLWKTLVHVLQFVVGYAIMLSVMTYNIWILITVTLGSGIGYYFFSILETKTNRCLPQKSGTAYTRTEKKVLYRTFIEHEVLVKENGDHELLVKENGDHELLVKKNEERELWVNENGEHEIWVKENCEHEVLVKENGDHDLLVKENGEHETLMKENEDRELWVKENGEHEVLVKENGQRELVKKSGQRKFIVTENGETALLAGEAML